MITTKGAHDTLPDSMSQALFFVRFDFPTNGRACAAAQLNQCIFGSDCLVLA